MNELPEDVTLHDKALPDTRGNDTPDRVFCFSVNEAEWYSRDDEARICYPTDFARCRGIGTCGRPTEEWENEKRSWHRLLRTPGVSYKCAECVDAGALSDFTEVLSGKELIPSGRQETVFWRSEMIFDRQDGVLPGRIISIDLGTGESPESVRPRNLKTGSLNDAAVGDVIGFGHYPGIPAGENNPEPPPVPWLVLDRTPEELLLISREVLDSRPYHGEFRDVVWEDCDLRKWLNGEFLHAFFTASEQARILVSRLMNEDNPEYRTPGGGVTSDRVFCLSISEARRYFADDAAGRCGPAESAIRKGLWANEEGYCYWWLRSPGRYGFNAAAMDPFGELWTDGNTVNGEDHGGVRPAMRISAEPPLSDRG